MGISAMNILGLIALQGLQYPCHAFLSSSPPPPSSSTQIQTLSFNSRTDRRRSPRKLINESIKTSKSRLHGIAEWREQNLESHYTLDIYQQQQQQAPNTSTNSLPQQIPGEIPILPFPFTDILMQGERTQLNLYEQRFHLLFQDVMDNYCGVVCMGLLTGNNGMITTMPICEVESFSRVGQSSDASSSEFADPSLDDYGMGDGSIFVTIRAVGRAKIAEGELVQETPYMKAKVVEMFDEDIMSAEAKSDKAEGGEEDSNEGLAPSASSSTAIEVASTWAGNIEVLLRSLGSLDYQLGEVEEEKERKKQEKKNDNGSETKEEVMNRRLINAQLESLFFNSDDEVELDDSTDSSNEISNDDDDIDDEEEEKDDDISDRMYRFETAFESAKETDTQGYIIPPTTTTNDTPNTPVIRSPKDLVAISWAAFCTGEKGNIALDVFKIQALDMTNVLQRLRLASAMLREEKKQIMAKLAKSGVKDVGKEEEDE